MCDSESDDSRCLTHCSPRMELRNRDENRKHDRNNQQGNVCPDRDDYRNEGQNGTLRKQRISVEDKNRIRQNQTQEFQRSGCSKSPILKMPIDYFSERSETNKRFSADNCVDYETWRKQRMSANKTIEDQNRIRQNQTQEFQRCGCSKPPIFVKKMPIDYFSERSETNKRFSADNCVDYETYRKQIMSANKTIEDQNRIRQNQTQEFQRCGCSKPPIFVQKMPTDYFSERSETNKRFSADNCVDDDDELSEILNKEEIEWDKLLNVNKDGSGPKKSREPQSHPNKECLIEDNYLVYPGLIDDAVNRKIDFNRISFDITFGKNPVPKDIPEDIPLDLIEAFDLRVEKEQKIMRNITQVSNMPRSYDRNAPAHFVTLQNQSLSFNVINREENLLATAVEIDLLNLTKDKPMNEISTAISSLQRAELMNDYDKSSQAAEEAFKNAPPHLAEAAAISKVKSFKTDQISKNRTKIATPNYRPIEIVSYMGLTKPNYEIPPNT